MGKKNKGKDKKKRKPRNLTIVAARQRRTYHSKNKQEVQASSRHKRRQHLEDTSED